MAGCSGHEHPTAKPDETCAPSAGEHDHGRSRPLVVVRGVAGEQNAEDERLVMLGAQVLELPAAVVDGFHRLKRRALAALGRRRKGGPTS